MTIRNSYSRVILWNVNNHFRVCSQLRAQIRRNHNSFMWNHEQATFTILSCSVMWSLSLTVFTIQGEQWDLIQICWGKLSFAKLLLMQNFIKNYMDWDTMFVELIVLRNFLMNNVIIIYTIRFTHHSSTKKSNAFINYTPDPSKVD